MKKVIIGLFLLCLLVYANDALDELLKDDVIVSPQDPAITSIIRQMDEAQENRDVALFKSLLEEYKRLNPPIEIENGPDVELGGLSPVNEDYIKDRWTADDIIVNVAYAYQAFSMDSRDGNRVYLAASRRQNSGDNYTIPVWYSDDGITWYNMYNLWVSNHNLYNPSLKIVETPDTDYLFIAFEAYEASSPYDQDIWVFRSNLMSGGWAFFNPANNSSIDERDPSLDADDHAYGAAFFLHLAFESADSIAYIRSVDKGATWVDRVIVGSGFTTYDYIDPSCAYGTNTPQSDSFNLGVAWVYKYNQTRKIRVRRNRYKGSSSAWLSSTHFNPPSGHFDNHPSLKLTRGNYNSAVITFERKDTAGTDDADLYEFYTYNAGRNWTDDGLYMPGASVTKLNCLSVDDGLGDYHVFFKGSNDDIRYKEAHYNYLAYSGWTGSIPISDGGDISNSVSPASAVRGSDPCVCWKIFVSGGNDTLKFDALWLQTGIDEETDISTVPLLLSPNPSNGIATLSYAVEKEGNVKISLHDVTGRMVENLVNENKKVGNYSINLNNKGRPTGIYFVHMETPGGLYTRKMTVVK